LFPRLLAYFCPLFVIPLPFFRCPLNEATLQVLGFWASGWMATFPPEPLVSCDFFLRSSFPPPFPGVLPRRKSGDVHSQGRSRPLALGRSFPSPNLIPPFRLLFPPGTMHPPAHAGLISCPFTRAKWRGGSLPAPDHFFFHVFFYSPGSLPLFFSNVFFSRLPLFLSLLFWTLRGAPATGGY